MSTSISLTLPRAATTARSTVFVPGASVRRVQLPSAAKNRKWPVADVGTSAVNSPLESSSRTRDWIPAAQHAALNHGFFGHVDAGQTEAALGCCAHDLLL